MKSNLGLRIKHFRELKRLTQVELAAAIGATKTTVYRWEHGLSWPEYEKLEAICRALSVKMDDLFHDIAQSAMPHEPSAEQLVYALFAVLDDPKFRDLFLNVLRNHRIGDLKR